MAIVYDFNNPSFCLLAVNNNRTAWKPVGVPVILVVPHRYDPNGTTLPNSGILNLRIYIEDVPREALVAGHQHIGQRFPDKELYAITLSSIELGDRLIPLVNTTIAKTDGTAVELSDAVTGDIVTLTTSTGLTDQITFVSDADYYDLSDVLIEVELLPPDQYNLVYQAGYFNRAISTDGLSEFLCIDASTTAVAIFKFKIDHPGKVLNEFYRLTPPPYLTSAKKSEDKTVDLYRPFTDILNDAMDEQGFIPRINWVFDAPPEAIPYLSSLLGWDIPYFPKTLDKLRKAVLRRTVELQNLKGSRRAIINIFRLFGFEILISNLWWSQDGKRFIRPDENLPFGYQDQKITTVAKQQIDSLLSAYVATGFTTLEIPLLFRPQELNGLDSFTALKDGGHLTIIAYVVAPDSDADIALGNIATSIFENPKEYGSTTIYTTDENGFTFPDAIGDAVAGLEILGFSEINIAGKFGLPTHETIAGQTVPFTTHNVKFNRETNKLTLVLNGNTEFRDNHVYAFAVYERYEFSVPALLENLESNRFDIQILTEDLVEFADPQTLDFAIEFLYRLKAFHSLLNAIATRIDLTETYEVTDLSIGGDITQRYDTDIGRLQVPPAIIPNIPTDSNDCTLFDARALGYKDSDILLRLRKLANMPEEHAAWKALDGRESTTGDTRLSPTSPATGRTSCLYTNNGQDRITTSQRIEARDIIETPSPNANMGDSGFIDNKLSQNDIADNGEFDTGVAESSNSNGSAFGSFVREFTEIRNAFCELDRVTDYKYKGRVDDELLHSQIVIAEELGRIRPIYLAMGNGVYWTYPTITVPCVPGTKKPDNRGYTNKIKFSGDAPEATQEYYSTGVANEYLKASYSKPLPAKNNNILGRLYRDYGTPTNQTIHYSNRNTNKLTDQRFQLALQRPNLDITKPTLHFPGCRFARLNALESDFTHSTYTARPWDFSPCGSINVCGKTEPTYLNYYMVIDDAGNEQLVYDSEQYTNAGNGLPPDIPSLGDHVLTTSSLLSEADFIHKVYMKNSTANPAVTFDEACDYDSAVSDDLLETTDPLFSSHNTCSTDPTIATDYADGYACVSGYQSYIADDLGRGIYDEVLVGLGLTSISGTDGPSNVILLLGSGVRHETVLNYRLDAGCLLVNCGDENNQSLCALSSYLDQNDEYDWSPDHLNVEAQWVEVETIDVPVILLDGTIPSLMELI